MLEQQLIEFLYYFKTSIACLFNENNLLKYKSFLDIFSEKNISLT